MTLLVPLVQETTLLTFEQRTSFMEKILVHWQIISECPKWKRADVKSWLTPLSFDDMCCIINVVKIFSNVFLILMRIMYLKRLFEYSPILWLNLNKFVHNFKIKSINMSKISSYKLKYNWIKLYKPNNVIFFLCYI